MRYLRFVLFGLIGLVVLAAVGAAGALVWRGKLQHDVAERRAITGPNTIDVMETIEIGGIPQVVRIRGRNLNNPVLLFLHGGPGTSMIPFAHAFQDALENDFTIVQWDQRGAGLTAKLSDQAEIRRAMSIERMESDVIEMTNYLRKRFDQDRILLMGHSWGSILGLPIAYRHPELYSAFIGVGQVIDVRRGEAMGYERDLMMAEKLGERRAVEELRAIAPYPPAGAWRGENLEVRHDWNEYFGESVFGYRSMAQAMIKFAWASPDYSIGDIYGLMTANNDVYDNLDLYIHSYKVADTGSDWRIPVFFIMGRYDYQVNPDLVQEYFDTINAPQKGLFFIERAAHAPMVERPRAFADIVLNRIRPAVFRQPAAPEPARSH